MPVEKGELTKEVMDALAEKFPDDKVHIKPGVFQYSDPQTKKKPIKTMWLSYLQHTDVATRLDEVLMPPGLPWSFAAVNSWEKNSGKSEKFIVAGTLTIGGVSRDNVGEGKEWKDAYSDCLKRCAMLFGVGRYLYDSVSTWTEWHEKMKHQKYMLSDLPALGKAEAGQMVYPGGKPEKSKSTGKSKSETQGSFKDFLDAMAILKTEIADLKDGDTALYYVTLASGNFKHANEIKGRADQKLFYGMLKDEIKAIKSGERATE